MRWRSSFVWVLLLGAAVAVWLEPRVRPQSAVASAHPLEDKPPNGQPNAWNGAGTVLAVSVITAVLLALGLIWYAVDQNAQRTAIAKALTHGYPARAPALITRYGCGGCHTIPSAPGADGKVGPDLSGLIQRVYLGGVLRNTPVNLVQWIVDPQRFLARSAMPVTGISEAEARDVAAYLYAH
jgi:cytochrome c2